MMTAPSTSGTQPPAQPARRPWALPAVLLTALLLRGGLLAAGAFPFNSDEAIVGLMARHILLGERPTFFYGQAYLGALDAWLVAGGFALLGESVLVIRLVQTALYLGVLATTYWLGLRIFRSQWLAGAAALFLAIPPVLFTLYTTVSLGGYGEALLLGNLTLLLALGLLSQPRPAGWRAALGWLALGGLGGLGFWTFPLTLAYFVPASAAGVVVYWRRWVALLAGAALAAAGFALGAAPWVAYTLRHGLVTVAEAGGAAIAGASPENPIFAVFAHAFYFLLFGPTVVWGMRPPWSADFLALPLVPYALAVHLGALGFALRRLGDRRDGTTLGRALLAGLCGLIVAGFVLSPFGADPSGRYFLPLVPALALFTAEMFHWLRLRRRQRRSLWRKWFGQALALALVAFYWWGNVQAAHSPPGLTTQFDAATRVDHGSLEQLMAFLRAEGETHGYTTYWVAYPLAFLSQETLIFVPRLPYHADFRYTPRDSRYAPYEAAVAASDRTAFITARNPHLDLWLRAALEQWEISYSERAFGDYRVFYGLSRKVGAQALDFGDDCCRR